MGQYTKPIIGAALGAAAIYFSGGAATPMVMAAMAGAGAGMQMEAADQKAHADRNQAIAEKQANEYNATVLRNNAAAENDAATQRESAQRFRIQQAEGRARTIAAESGSGMDGSNWDLMRQNAVQGELDVLNVRHAGRGAADGLLSQANLQDYQGQVAQMRQVQAVQAGRTAQTTAAINGVSSIYGSGVKSGTWGVKPTTTTGTR